VCQLSVFLRFVFVLAGCCFLFCGPAALARSKANLSIRIENPSPLGGILRLGIYNEASYPDDNSKPIASADVPVSGGRTIVVLHGIPPGEYAIETFQDINGNGKMDFSWIGLPREPFGFSRDARPGLGKPAFERVKFVLLEGENTQVIHLQNGIDLFH
jgi:uncharacterized protein (DUF2141 family)